MIVIFRISLLDFSFRFTFTFLPQLSSFSFSPAAVLGFNCHVSAGDVFLSVVTVSLTSPAFS